MAFKAKNGSKWKHHWSWPFLHISIELLVLVAGRISANHRISGLTGKAGQEFSPKIVYFWRSKMFLHICTVGLGSTNSASEVGMVENVKLNHDLDTNFCNLSPFLRHSVLVHWNVAYIYQIAISLNEWCLSSSKIRSVVSNLTSGDARLLKDSIQRSQFPPILAKLSNNIPSYSTYMFLSKNVD